MKSGFTIVLTLLIIGQSRVSFSQDNDKNESLYGVVNISFLNNTSVVNTFLVPGQGDQTLVIDPSQSFAIGFEYHMGYFIIPKKLTLGGGLGLLGYNNPDMPTLPLYFDARYFTREDRHSLYFYSSLGSLVKISEVFYKGAIGRIGVGYTFFTTEKLKTNLEISYCLTGVSLTEQAYFSSDDKLSIQGIRITLGFVLF